MSKDQHGAQMRRQVPFVHALPLAGIARDFEHEVEEFGCGVAALLRVIGHCLSSMDGDNEANDGIEALGLNPVVVDLAEKLIAREDPSRRTPSIHPLD